MKIVHYIPSIDVTSGGISSYMQLLSRDLGRLCELHIITHKTGNMLQLENCAIHFLSSGLLNYFKVKSEFKRLLKLIHPDVFHSNCCWYPFSAFTIMWAKQEGYKTVLTPHGMLEPWIVNRNYWTKKLPAINIYQRRAVKNVDIVHTTADSEKQNLIELGWNNNIITIPNCVQIDKMNAKSYEQSSKTILFLSRIHPKKGIEMLIHAVERLKLKLNGWKVLIVGNGEERYILKLKRLVKEYNVDNIMLFKAPVYGEKKFELYRNADLFILPTYSENFGIVVAEALACGTPVITTKGAPWTDLEDYNCGWWCECNEQSIEKALTEFLAKTQKELDVMGNNGRKLIESKYSSISVVKNFVAMYNSMVI